MTRIGGRVNKLGKSREVALVNGSLTHNAIINQRNKKNVEVKVHGFNEQCSLKTASDAMALESLLRSNSVGLKLLWACMILSMAYIRRYRQHHSLYE